MPGRPTRGHGVRVDVNQDRDGRIDGAPSALFLVELRANGSAPTDAEDMRRALQYAIARLSAAGVPIRWTGGVLVPREARCLCFVEGADQAQVLAARDVAGIGSATVQPVRPLPDLRLPGVLAHRPQPSTEQR